MAALESTSVQPVLEIPSDLDARSRTRGAEEGADPQSAELVDVVSSRVRSRTAGGTHTSPRCMCALHKDFLWDDPYDAENILPANTAATRSSCNV